VIQRLLPFVTSRRALPLPAAFAVAALLPSAFTPALANLGETGLGSRSTALAGAAGSWNQGGFSAYSNPAALALAGQRRLQLSYGWTLMDPSFTPIEGVTLENSYNGDRNSTNERVGDVTDNYRTVLGQLVGASYVIAPDWHGLTAGATLYSPFDQLGFVDTGETFIPEYVLYRARNQRPQLELGLGARLGDRLTLGAGAHVSFGLSATGTLFLQAQSGKPSTLRVTASVKPKASPVAGWLWNGGSYTLSQVVRLANSARSEMNFNSSARAFGDLAALDVQFSALSSLFYDPLAIETGWSWQYSPSARLIVQLDLQGWRSFSPPAALIRQPEDDCTISAGTSTCAGLEVSAGILPGYPLRNIAIPRLAHEWSSGSTAIRAGYAYRPGIFSAPPTGAGNYLDPSRHMASLGAGWRFGTESGFPAPIELDAHLIFHQLVSQQIEKTSGTEAGDAGTKIGAPGYSAGGRVWGGGVSLTMAL
jgi:hypothetical protein